MRTAAKRESSARRLLRRGAVMTALASALALMPAAPADARLSILPGRPGARPTPTVAGSLSGCQQLIRRASAELAANVRAALADCLATGLPCLFDAAGAPSCCAQAAPRCARQADAVAAAGAAFVAQVVGKTCSSVSFAELLAETGLDYGRTAAACLRLEPALEVDGLGSLASCLERIVTEDVLHLVASTEQPRAVEALVCMDLESRFPGVLRDRPASCEEPEEPVATPSPTPTPIATPATSATPPGSPTPGGSVTPAPSASPGAPTPTAGATPTPGGGPGCTTATVTLALTFSQTEFPDVSGVTLTVGYPATVGVPGFAGEPSVLERVSNLTNVSGGLFNVGDQDPNGDNVDDQLNIGLISLGSPIPPGNFARVRFDCTSGASAPAASAFSCAVDASTFLGNPVNAQCVITVATP